MKIRLHTEKRVITFKLEEELLRKLDLYAVNARVTRSEVIREALKRYLGGEQ
jgi:metal-responsive CopG/Arc/MetJ family transcriptional regulator